MDQPFIFLDLPTELQDRVYNVYLEDIRPMPMTTSEAHAVQTAASGFTLQYLPQLILRTFLKSGIKQTSHKFYRDYEKRKNDSKGSLYKLSCQRSKETSKHVRWMQSQLQANSNYSMLVWSTSKPTKMVGDSIEAGTQFSLLFHV